jgi:2-methylcitrate dehydratase PrpD
MGMTIAGRFAEFLTDLKFDQLPTDVVDRTKLFLLDWLGCAIRGREEVEAP